MAASVSTNGVGLWVPSAEVMGQCRVPDASVLRARASDDPVEFWEAEAREPRVVRAVVAGPGRQSRSVLPMVRRRQDQHRAQRARPPPANGDP